MSVLYFFCQNYKIAGPMDGFVFLYFLRKIPENLIKSYFDGFCVIFLILTQLFFGQGLALLNQHYYLNCYFEFLILWYYIFPCISEYFLHCCVFYCYLFEKYSLHHWYFLFLFHQNFLFHSYLYQDSLHHWYFLFLFHQNFLFHSYLYQDSLRGHNCLFCQQFHFYNRRHQNFLLFQGFLYLQ